MYAAKLPATLYDPKQLSRNSTLAGNSSHMDRHRSLTPLPENCSQEVPVHYGLRIVLLSDISRHVSEGHGGIVEPHGCNKYGMLLSGTVGCLLKRLMESRQA